MDIYMVVAGILALGAALWYRSRIYRNGSFSQEWGGTGRTGPPLEIVRDPALRARVVEVFRHHGVTTDIQFTDASTPDHVTFVLVEGSQPDDPAALIADLRALLKHRVSVVPDGEKWAGRTTWL